MTLTLPLSYWASSNRGSKPLGIAKPSYQQNAVEKTIYPRINAPVLGKLSTHKRSRSGLKARINTPAFAHKHSRLFASRLCNYWRRANPPVSTSITNNPIVKGKTHIGCAKMRINTYE